MTQVKWEGSTALITGASRGIGRAVARAAATRRASVGLVSQSESDLEKVRDELPGRRSIAVADVGSQAQIDGAVAAIQSDLGPIDIVVANAGIGSYGFFIDVDPTEIERLFTVNVFGTMNLLRAVLPEMIQRRRGHVVIVGSIAGRIGTPFEAAYSATKFAQIGLAESLSVELSAFGIGVSIVNPGPVDTGFFERRGVAYSRPFPRKVAPERVAEAVMQAVEPCRFEQFVPRWFRPAVLFRHLAPPIYQLGTRQSFKSELADLSRRSA